MEIKIHKVTKPDDTPELLFGLYQILGKLTIREMTTRCKINVEIVPIDEEEAHEDD